jgi:5'-3' exonuclease
VILVDNTQIILSSIFSQYKTPESIVENEDPLNLIRHITLNTYLSIKHKFGSEYGDLIICQDAGNYWRKDIFSHYKANRKKVRDDNSEYWDKIYECLKTIRTEVAENMPYKNMLVPRCEADDIIAVLSRHYGTEEKVLIVSNDKDFKQLLASSNINLYSHQKKAFVDCPDPNGDLYEQIVRGDSSDGIPNIMSDSDTFVVDGKRQKPMTAKRVDEFVKSIPNDLKEAFERNQKLIDLSYIPMEYQNAIIEEYTKKSVPRSKMFNYFTENKLVNLMSSLSEF